MYYYTISHNELNRYLQKPDTILVDLRTPEAFYKGHIPGAVNTPYRELLMKPFSTFNREIVILYCDRGNQSLLAARELQKRGVTAFSVYGGYSAYRGPIERTPQQMHS